MAENRYGITRLDIERLKQISELFDVPIEELLNADDGISINEIKDNHMAVDNSTVNIHASQTEKDLYG